MSDTANSAANTPNNDLQVIALNVSYSLLYDSVPRSGSLKVIINSVPADLLKKTEMTRKKRFTNPSEKMPLSEDEKIVKKVVDMATLNTVTNLQRRFSQVLDELRSVSKDTFEKLKVLNYDEFCDNLKASLEKDGVKDYDIKAEVDKQECGICLESYTLHKSFDANDSRKRTLDDKDTADDANVSKKMKTNDNETINDPEAKPAEEASPYTHEPVILTNCPHIFGRSCLYAWGNKNNSCPLCRTKISTKNVEYTMEELNEVLQNDESLTSMNFTELLEQSDRSAVSSVPLTSRFRSSYDGFNEDREMETDGQHLFPGFANTFSQVLESAMRNSWNDSGSDDSNADPQPQERGTVYIVSGNDHIAAHRNYNNDNAQGSRPNPSLSRVLNMIRGNIRNPNSPVMTVFDMLATLFNSAGTNPFGVPNEQTPTSQGDESNGDSPSTDPRNRTTQADIAATAAIAEAVRMAMEYRNHAHFQRHGRDAENNDDHSSDTNNDVDTVD